MSMLQKSVNTVESCNELLKCRSTVTKIVAVFTNIEINGPNLVHRWGYEWQINGQIVICGKWPQAIDTDVAHYNFNEHQWILVIFGRDVVKKVY